MADIRGNIFTSWRLDLFSRFNMVVVNCMTVLPKSLRNCNRIFFNNIRYLIPWQFFFENCCYEYCLLLSKLLVTIPNCFSSRAKPNTSASNFISKLLLAPLCKYLVWQFSKKKLCWLFLDVLNVFKHVEYCSHSMNLLYRECFHLKKKV